MSLLIPLALLLAPGCLDIADARITAAHLKTIIPELAPINDGVEFGYAPAPGTTRWIRPAEVVAFSARHGLAVGHVAEVCVTRGAHALTQQAAEAAILRALGRLAPNEEAHVEIIDFLRLPLPMGDIEFSPRDVHVASRDTILWRGRVGYDHNRSVPVWVKAKIQIGRQSLHARAAIPQGQTIADEDLEVRLAWVPLEEALKSKQPISAAGMEASHDIAPGQRITPNLLTRPLAVKRGDALRAVAESGGVRLTIEAIARKSGRVGDVISIENVSNKRMLRAAIAAPGHVRILYEVSENEKHLRGSAAAGARSAGGQRQESAAADSAGGAHREPGDGASGLDRLTRQPL